MSAGKSFMEPKGQGSAEGHAGKGIAGSKEEARKKGDKSYFTGKPCKRGHSSARSASSGMCLACSVMHKKGLITDLKRKPKGYWLSVENVTEEAKKYKTKSEMKSKNSSAYIGMSKLKIADELFPNGKKSNGHWTLDKCIEAAKKYSSIAEFAASNDSGALANLYKMGNFKEHTSHMESEKHRPNHWDYESCKAEASMYLTRNEFRHLATGAYGKAREEGWLDDICSHMESGYKVTDCVYIWKVRGLIYKGMDVYKIGIAKEGLVDRRVYVVSNVHRIEPEFTLYFKRSNPHHVESMCLKLGVKVPMNKRDGYTEFRAMTPDVYAECLEIMKGE